MNTKQTQGFLPVIAALGGNIFITIIKWIGFFVSGSGAMFSEAVHSVADVFNQILLLIGIQRSKKPSNDDHPYGYGTERFFWAIISACSIFFVGSGVTIYHGINALVHVEEVHVNFFTLLILFVSFVIESGTFIVAYRELKFNNKNKDFKEMMEEGDPTTIAVLYEDGVAVLGVMIAFVSILLTYFTGRGYWDAIGSILIGLLLGFMAVVLINKNRTFLIRKSVPEEITERIVEILEADPAIEKVLDLKSIVIDVATYHVKCEVEINGSALMRKMYRDKALKNQFEEVRHDYDDFLKFCVDYADRVPRIIGTRIDDVEKKITDEIPEVRYIDIEVN
jgi:zinc transporter 9